VGSAWIVSGFMSAERFTLDTNILIYAVDRDAGYRHTRAKEIVDQAVDQNCVLTLQALSEFYTAVSRKNKLLASEAKAQVADWRLLFPVVVAQSDNLIQAIEAVEQHRLSFWDAMLWSVARDNSVTLLISEDFQHGRELLGVRFHNPFVVS